MNRKICGIGTGHISDGLLSRISVATRRVNKLKNGAFSNPQSRLNNQSLMLDVDGVQGQ